jgi:hypothetical protein
MNKQRLQIQCGVLALMLTAVHDAGAEDFKAVSLADESLQTRSFEDVSGEQLLRSSLAVIQDIRFMVTEAEVESGLIVAWAPGCRCASTPTLTVHVTPTGQEPGSYRVRLSLAVRTEDFFGQPENLDYSQFYQNFFTHLGQALFARRNRP